MFAQHQIHVLRFLLSFWAHTLFPWLHMVLVFAGRLIFKGLFLSRAAVSVGWYACSSWEGHLHRLKLSRSLKCLAVDKATTSLCLPLSGSEDLLHLSANYRLLLSFSLFFYFSLTLNLYPILSSSGFCPCHFQDILPDLSIFSFHPRNIRSNEDINIQSGLRD